MKECNQGTKPRKVGGRRRTWIDFNDLAEPPTETMMILAQLKNDGRSWRSLADELNVHSTESISHSLVRRVALGQCKSLRIDYVLGTREKPPPVPVEPCPSCGKVHKQLKECRPKPPPRDKVRLSLWVTREERDFIREAWDSHPGGRVAWNLEHAKDGRS